MGVVKSVETRERIYIGSYGPKKRCYALMGALSERPSMPNLAVSGPDCPVIEALTAVRDSYRTKLTYNASEIRHHSEEPQAPHIQAKTIFDDFSHNWRYPCLSLADAVENWKQLPTSRPPLLRSVVMLCYTADEESQLASDELKTQVNRINVNEYGLVHSSGAAIAHVLVIGRYSAGALTPNLRHLRQNCMEVAAYLSFIGEDEENLPATLLLAGIATKDASDLVGDDLLRRLPPLISGTTQYRNLRVLRFLQQVSHLFLNRPGGHRDDVCVWGCTEVGVGKPSSRQFEFAMPISLALDIFAEYIRSGCVSNEKRSPSSVAFQLKPVTPYNRARSFSQSCRCTPSVEDVKWFSKLVAHQVVCGSGGNNVFHYAVRCNSADEMIEAQQWIDGKYQLVVSDTQLPWNERLDAYIDFLAHVVSAKVGSLGEFDVDTHITYAASATRARAVRHEVLPPPPGEPWSYNPWGHTDDQGNILGVIPAAAITHHPTTT